MICRNATLGNDQLLFSLRDPAPSSFQDREFLTKGISQGKVF
jgi:hypothetical protein